jgi:CHAD domain-containing protein
VTHPATVAAFLTRALQQACDALAAVTTRVGDDTDKEAVHDLRVTLRKLRVLLKLARPAFGRGQAHAVRRACASLQRATSPLRDLEVLEETLATLHRPGVRVRAARVGRREETLRRQLVALCQAGAVEHARGQLALLLASPVQRPGLRPLAPWAAQRVDAARRRVLRRLRKGRCAKGLHRLRLAFKRLRYTVELLSDLLPPELQALAPLAASAQQELGRIHDLDVALEQVKRSDLVHRRKRARSRTALARARRRRVHRLKAGALAAFDP